MVNLPEVKKGPYSFGLKYKYLKIPQITRQIKIKQRRPPEHHKISPQQLFTKLNPLVKKSKNNSTTLESRLKQQKLFDKEILS